MSDPPGTIRTSVGWKMESSMSVTMEVEAAAAPDGARIGARSSGPSDPEPPLEVIERELVACASQLFALESRFLALVAAFDRRQGWVGAGVRSCAHWLSWRCGISLHSARERVRVARALETLPAISRAFDEGRVSYSKVRAVTRVATPADEQTWLEVAESGTATHVERIAGGYRRATAPDPADDVPGFTSSDDQPEPEPEDRAGSPPLSAGRCDRADHSALGRGCRAGVPGTRGCGRPRL